MQYNTIKYSVRQCDVKCKFVSLTHSLTIAYAVNITRLVLRTRDFRHIFNVLVVVFVLISRLTSVTTCLLQGEWIVKTS